MADERRPDEAALFERATAVSLGEEPETGRGALLPTRPGKLAVPKRLAGSSDLPRVSVEPSDPDTLLDGGARATPAELVRFQPSAFPERYLTRKLLGRGGMGEVHLCHDDTIGRDVAMKLIRPRPGEMSPTAQRRFAREARIQGQLEHPAIVPVYDVGVDPDGALYFTMKRVRGVSLARVLDGLRAGDPELTKRFSRRRLLTLFSNVCMAVHFSHEKGVVHRDLKPANIMLGDFGEVYVLDWGLAKVGVDPTRTSAVTGDGEARQTAAGGVMGTPGYMAPEQLEDPSNVDATADVYSLGSILFELLTLEPLHAAEAVADILVSTLSLEDTSPGRRAPRRDVPPELDRLCQDATRREPTERLLSAQALSAAIEKFLDGDRDLALRRELAMSHALRAQGAVERASSADDPAVEQQERAQSMREVTAALGLDPGHQGALRTLMKLIAEPPRSVPSEVQEAIASNRKRAYLIAGRSAFVFYLAYLLYLPLLFWMGVRDWGLFALGWVCIGACAITTRWLLNKPPAEVPLIHLAVGNITVAAVSVMFGPFVLVPMLALGSSVAYISSMGDRRGLVPLVACLAVLVPTALGWLGVIPNPYRFENGVWVIEPSVFFISPWATQLFLVAAILGTIIPACIFVARLRRAYAAAEEQLQLQAWHLQQIVPEEARQQV